MSKRYRDRKSEHGAPKVKSASPDQGFWRPAIVLLLFAIIIYIPSITNGFIWDDDVMLTNNTLMKEPDGLRRIWLSTELSDYFPLTSTSFWLEWRLWGMNPVGYNITNILLHGVAGILLWRVLLQLAVPGAWLAALLFVVHPVCVASVDWIAERKNTLSIVFYFAALLTFLRFEQLAKWRVYALSLGLFLLALLSKTSVVVLPIVLLLCAWWRRGTISRRDIARSVPFFALSLVLGLVTVWFQLHEVLAGEAPETDTILVRVLGGSWGLWFYLTKIILPINLSFVYPQWQVDPAKWFSYLPGLLWVAALFLAWHFRRAWGRPVLFGLGYFTIALLPVLGFFDMDFLHFSQVSDHLQYIAVPGVIAMVVGVAVAVGRAYFSSNWQRRLVAMTPILILSALTWRQACIYKNEESLWRHTVRQNPKAWIAYHNLADTLVESGRFEEAASCYQEALRLKPTHAKSHNNLGNTLNLMGRVDEAIDHFLDAIQNKPEMAEAHHNLAVQYFGKNQFDSALQHYQRAIQFKPAYAPAYFGAGNCQLKLGNVAEALDFYFSGIRYNPESADGHYVVGLILKAQGEREAAKRCFRNSLKADPKYRPAWDELILLASENDEDSHGG